MFVRVVMRLMPCRPSSRRPVFPVWTRPGYAAERVSNYRTRRARRGVSENGCRIGIRWAGSNPVTPVPRGSIFREGLFPARVYFCVDLENARENGTPNRPRPVVAGHCRQATLAGRIWSENTTFDEIQGGPFSLWVATRSPLAMLGARQAKLSHRSPPCDTALAKKFDVRGARVPGHRGR